MQVAEKIVDALLEGEMPDWLKKKISGKAEEEDGDGGGDDDGGEKKPKKSSSSSSTSTDVAGALGKIGH